jgi:hypothetical protein
LLRIGLISGDEKSRVYYIINCGQHVDLTKYKDEKSLKEVSKCEKYKSLESLEDYN